MNNEDKKILEGYEKLILKLIKKDFLINNKEKQDLYKKLLTDINNMKKNLL